MQRILCSTAILALLMGSGTVLAQNNNTAQPGTPAVEGDCTGNAANTERCKAKNNDQSNTTGANDSMSTGTTAPATGANADPANPGTTTAATTTMPAGAQFLASQFIGRTVYSSANENVGEINDLVMNKDLDTIVAIVGVGGFLGIGEKDVAIPIDQITVTTEASTTTGTGTGTDTTATGTNPTPKLTIAQTREQLEAAPAFDRTALAR